MIYLKNNREITIMREGGKILAEIMAKLKDETKVGIKTIQLEILAKNLIKKNQVKPSFLGEDGFPSVLCVSINDEIVHGLPSERVIKNGDIVSLDFGIIYKGFHSDMAITIPVGEVEAESLRLIKTTKKVLKLAIKKAKVGNTLGDVGNIIERYITARGFYVIKDLCGHGIGRRLHEDPQVLNFGKRYHGIKLEEGMTICIEPMAAVGTSKIKQIKGEFAFRTTDGSMSSHFEHTIAITKNGPKILTKI